MRKRRFWIETLENAWRRRPVVWLSGVRRAGKTTLSQSLPGTEYFDCELPRVRRELADPEAFLATLRGKTVVLDEIHRLGDPAQLLKIAADHFPRTRVLATGSSTLGASRKFRDTLAGRKAEVWLTPMMTADLTDFGAPDLKHRFLRGGLPPFFLADSFPERDFQEWMDAYWAKDIQELFRLERRHSFQRFAELLFIQSGGMFEATRFARDCEVSRTTIANYLAVLEATLVRSSSGDRVPASRLLRQPDVRLADLIAQERLPNFELDPSARSHDLASVETTVKYVGYLRRQEAEIQRAQKDERRRIPTDFLFDRVPGLSREVIQRLSQVRPDTLGHALRIPGVTPAAVAVLGAYVGRIGGGV